MDFLITLAVRVVWHLFKHCKGLDSLLSGTDGVTAMVIAHTVPLLRFLRLITMLISSHLHYLEEPGQVQCDYPSQGAS